MRQRSARHPGPVAPQDVGTLWTMTRSGLTARCALLSWAEGWELRVIVDGDTMLIERCGRADEAFAIAERWKRRLGEQAWQQIVPRPGAFGDGLRGDSR
jgi:hypothetical protein